MEFTKIRRLSRFEIMLSQMRRFSANPTEFKFWRRLMGGTWYRCWKEFEAGISDKSGEPFVLSAGYWTRSPEEGYEIAKTEKYKFFREV